MLEDSLPLGGGGHPAGQTGDDAVLEHVQLQAGLAVSVVALEDLNTQNIRISPQSPLLCGPPSVSSLCCCSPASRSCRSLQTPRSASSGLLSDFPRTLKTKLLSFIHPAQHRDIFFILLRPSEYQAVRRLLRTKLSGVMW